MAKQRFLRFGFLGWLWTASLGIAANTYNLPQLANGGGLIRTTFISFNNGDTPATVELTLRNDSGDPLPLELSNLGTSSMHTFELQPGETRFLETTGEGPVQTGSAQAVSTAPIGFSGIFSLLQPNGGILTEAGVSGSAGLTQFVIAVDSTGFFNTGIALQNLSGADNEATFTLLGGPAGFAIPAGGTTQTRRTLSGNGHLSVFVSGPGGLFPEIVSTRGTLLVQTESKMAALTLRQGQGGSPLTTLPVVSTDSAETSFVLPQVANGPGIRTQFILFGLGGAGGGVDGSAHVNINLTDRDGTAFPVALSNGESGSSFDLAVGPTEAIFLETDGVGPLRQGAARVNSNQPVGLTAVFSLLDSQGRITTEAGIGASPALAEFSLPVDLTSGFDTGLAVYNPGDSAATLGLQFIDEDGSAVPADVQLDAHSSAWIGPQGAVLPLQPFNKLARFVSQLISGLGAARGQLAVTADHPVVALTLRQGQTTLTTLPVEPGVPHGGGPAAMDDDGDGLSSGVERSLGTDPKNVDSDCDGTADGDEIGNPANPTDSDGDGLIDALESSLVDSDSDGTVDQSDPDTVYSISCGLFTPFAVSNDGRSSTRLEVRIHGPAPTRVLARLLGGWTDVYLDDTPVTTVDVELFDDGTHGDREAGDHLFSRDGFTSTASSTNLVTDRVFHELEIEHDGETTIFRAFEAGGYFTAFFLGVVDAAEVTPPNVISPSLQTTGHLVNLVRPLDSLEVKRFLGGGGGGSSLATLSQFLYTSFDDVFDLLMFFPESPAASGAFGVLGPVQGSIGGIGLGSFDNTAFYGSAGQLQAVGARNFGNNGPTLHEWAHRWAVYLDPSFGFGGGHWGFSGTGRGQLGGFDPATLVDNMDGTYTVGAFGTIANGGDSVAYSKIELYLAGLAGADEVGDIPVAISPRNNSCDARTCTFEADGIRTVTIDEIIQEHGPRIPAPGEAQTSFRAAFIVASQRPLTGAEMAYYNVQAILFGAETGNGFLKSFQEATLGRATMDTSIPPPAAPPSAVLGKPVDSHFQYGSSLHPTPTACLQTMDFWLVAPLVPF